MSLVLLYSYCTPDPAGQLSSHHLMGAFCLVMKKILVVIHRNDKRETCIPGGIALI